MNSFGVMGIFMGLYSLFLFLVGVSLLVLIWVTILFLLKKMKQMDR
ncbi:MAG: hypothetical protein HGA35_05815 [Erysipelotrichaceae bacterium]|nr:hypothetical protein [Erysipelotrichaceae bacterium]